MAVALPPRAARRTASVAAAPTLAGALVAAFGTGGAEGRFHVGLAVLVVAAALFAFVGLTLRQATAALAFGAALAGALLLAVGVRLEQALSGAALVLGVGWAAQGLQALGRRVGAGRVAAGAVAFALLVAALTGLVWADRVAVTLPARLRWPVRQALLHLDPATALAYDAAGFDRLLDAPIYARVPLASSSVERPQAPRTAALWGALGVLAGAAAAALDRLRSVGRGTRSIPA